MLIDPRSFYTIVFAIIALVVGWSVWTGVTRMAARSLRPLSMALAVLLAGAGACYLIGQSKSGVDLRGLGGMLLCLLLLLAAGSLAFGAALRWLHDATRRRVEPEWNTLPDRPWDIWGLCALSILAVGISLLE
ncbi:hypothetical protein PARHAE_01301 [Paracoccus haematequi]|uniref:Transmembrane protein n=1 Tax=Paracoccus haematequi TaxID=2491866 RepID=A0A3S4DAL1_9RHOB|nr:hypothetical protein [Paracoccus haematequi]VDS08118.1 hypothetical protein PARHAE_01301 [Paracoccus haematequi]